jgi:hypothetical protein
MLAWERLVALAAALTLVVALPITDEIGFGLGVIVIAAHIWRTRRAPVAAAS